MKKLDSKVRKKKEKQLYLAEITYYNRLVNYELVMALDMVDAKEKVCLKFNYPKGWVNIKSIVH